MKPTSQLCHSTPTPTPTALPQPSLLIHRTTGTEEALLPPVDTWLPSAGHLNSQDGSMLVPLREPQPIP